MCSHLLHGWRFWSLEGAAPTPKATTATKAPRTRTKADSAETKPKATRKPRAKKNGPHRIIRPMDNQADVPEGQVRYWCDACMDMFLGFAGQKPEQCPNGHRIDDSELDNAVPEVGEEASG